MCFFRLTEGQPEGFSGLTLIAAVLCSTQLCPTLCDPVDCSPPVKKSRVGCVSSSRESSDPGIKAESLGSSLLAGRLFCTILLILAA